MPDPTTRAPGAPAPAAVAAPPYRPEEGWEPDYDELPPRPRRRLITPLNLGLLAVLMLAVGFIGGVLVEKQQTGSSSAAGGRAALRGLGGAATGATGAAAGGFGGRGGAAAANATVGTVSTVDGHTLYVTDSQGNTIKVTSASGGTVTRTALSSVTSVHPGDTVIVQGPRNPDGSISATSIRATAADAASSGGFAGLFGAGTRGAGAGTAAGGSGSAGGATGSGASGAGGSAGAATGSGSSSGGPALFGSG